MDNQQVSNTNYKPIPFATKYLINEYGDVFYPKLNRHIATCEVSGYLRLWIGCDDGSKAQFLVHRLVAITFLDNPEDKEQVNHKDGNKKNNHISNLEWASRQENMKHAFDTGLNSNVGEKNGKARLSEKQVLEIYQLCLDGLTNGQIADMYGINKNMVNLIKGKNSWGYLLKDLPDAKREKRSPMLTKEQKLRAKSLRESGMTSKQVAEMMGITLNQAESVTRTTR